jgi:hypothetical protein
LVLAADFVILGLDWAKPVESPYVEIGMLGTAFLFYFFLILVSCYRINGEYLIKNLNY